MTTKSIAPGRRPAQRSALFKEYVHDAYKSSAKLATPTLCPKCGAVFAEGRWRWLPRPADAHTELCPACHRIHDHFPAGYVKLKGAFLEQHRDEVIQLVRNLEKKEKVEHPLQRVMDIVDEDGGVLVTTTDVHLAHGIGEALHRAYRGTLDSHYDPAEKRVRVSWSRE
ncbi:MAG TPA: BCAM0308 family protein [Burkholderiales bacterium]|nr:BCAM0308 family protein [Burkholderiales bacterium]